MTQNQSMVEGGGYYEGLLRGWLSLAQWMGARGDAFAVGSQILNCYGQPHRRYHDLRHLAECLDLAVASEPDVLHMPAAGS